jgi:hypothetical protein
LIAEVKLLLNNGNPEIAMPVDKEENMISRALILNIVLD